MQHSDIENRFAYHPPTTEQRKSDHETVREMCKSLAHSLNALLPEGREKSLAVTHLEDAMMWANAALARQQDTD
jgi:hypothetical protein